MYNVCLVDHKQAVLVMLKFKLNHVNDFPVPQHVKISSTTFPSKLSIESIDNKYIFLALPEWLSCLLGVHSCPLVLGLFLFIPWPSYPYWGGN